MPDIAYVNGQFVPLQEAHVSVEDRGFQFGDGIYEVIRVYRGIPFRVDDHLARLERSAKEIALTLPISRPKWEQLIAEAIRLSCYRECKVYIQVTRGVAPRMHQFPVLSCPTVVMTVREHDEQAVALLQEQGVEAIVVPDIRWSRCDIKSLNLLPNVLAKQQALQAGAFEAIFVRQGMVTEGTASNVMAVQAGQLMTPALGDTLLAGVTREVVLALARQEGLSVVEKPLPATEMESAEELF
ncbi:MAG: D-amino acid aminotransferase, partial [Nitrospirae bacterium]